MARRLLRPERMEPLLPQYLAKLTHPALEQLLEAVTRRSFRLVWKDRLEAPTQGRCPVEVQP